MTSWKRAFDEEVSRDDWPDPIPLAAVIDLPTFPVEVLPEWMRGHVVSVAKALQVPADLPAVLGLVALSVCAARRATFRLGMSWVEPANIYAVIAAPPGSGKSPVFRKMVGPLDRWAAQEAERMAPEIARAEQKRRMLENQRTKAEKAGDDTEAIHAQVELERLDVPVAPLLSVDDATPEKMVEILAAQDGRLAILSPEGGLFDMIAGRYSDRANLDPYLKGHNGDPIDRRRISGASLVVQDPAITIGLTVQPSVIADLSKKEGFTGRGLVARFMYSMPPILIGRRVMHELFDIDPHHEATYERHIIKLLAELWDLRLDVSFDREATRMFLDWRGSLEARRGDGGDLASVQEWSQKLESTALRVAGLLHLADGWRHEQITRATMTRALAVAEYWLQHALSVYDAWGADEQIGEARHVLSWLKSHPDGGEVSVRDIWLGLRKTFPRTDDLRQPLGILTERGWIRPLFEGPLVLGSGTGPSPRFALHPSILWITPVETVTVSTPVLRCSECNLSLSSCFHSRQSRYAECTFGPECPFGPEDEPTTESDDGPTGDDLFA